MGNKKSKGKKWSRESSPSLFQTEKFAAAASGEDINTLDDKSEHNKNSDFVGEGPTMEDILTSLEGLLDKDDGKSFMGGFVVNKEEQKEPRKLPKKFSKKVSKKVPKKGSKKEFPLTSLKGFENDANLEQELIKALGGGLHEDRLSSDRENDYIDLDDLDFNEKDLLSGGATGRGEPLDLSGMEVAKLSSGKLSEIALDLEKELELVLKLEIEESETEESETEESETEEPEIEESETEESETEEPETEESETEESETEEPETEEPETEESETEEPETEEPETEEPGIEEPEVEPELRLEPELVASHAPDPDFVSEPHLPMPQQWTPEMLREAYGERVEEIVKEMTRKMLQESLPTILEEVVREELERIKRG